MQRRRSIRPRRCNYFRCNSHSRSHLGCHKSPEKKQATLNLINTLYTVPEVIDRLARLYRYRKYEEAGKTTKLQNPYDDQNSYDVLFDTATVLNYFEAACVQIKQKAVYKKLIYESGSRQLIGVRQVILGRFVAMTGIDPALAYPNLIEIADEFERPDSSVLLKSAGVEI